MDHGKENGYLKEEILHKKSCFTCGTLFTFKKSFSKYCSTSCKSAHYKKHNTKVAAIKRIGKGRNLSKEILDHLKTWTDFTHFNIETIIENADANDTMRKLKELGYKESLPQKEISFSFDGHLLIWKTMLGKYYILKKESVRK